MWPLCFIRKSWLAGTPDGLVNDPHDELSQPLGLVEIKNPYSARLMKPLEVEHFVWRTNLTILFII